jgi:phosphatidate phosphatase APP1
MAPFYHTLNTKLSPSWFYLSASPWQLYPLLHDFINSPAQSQTSTLYPPGQLVLRDMSRSAMPFYLSALTMGTQPYKVDRLSKIHSWLPEPTRQVILIGDSTQTDPEAYGEVARKWPGWIAAIWIRVVKGVNERKEKELNDPKRFKKAFEKVDDRLWRTFEDAKELESALVGLEA